MSIKNTLLFSAMRDIFYGGEFSNWLSQQFMPAGAMKEFEEAEDFFRKETGFELIEEDDVTAKFIGVAIIDGYKNVSRCGRSETELLVKFQAMTTSTLRLVKNYIYDNNDTCIGIIREADYT